MTDRDDTQHAFADVVNMTPAELEKRLDSEESQSVGYTDGRPHKEGEQHESVGHESGRKIISIKRKKKSELNETDVAHMRKVIGYVHRHLAQRPQGDIESSRWRYSLMNWGHDPLKDR